METNIIKQYNECIHHIEFYRANKDGNMFDAFYHSHLDFMQKSLEYMIKHETLIEIQTEEICPHCKAKLNYRVFKDERYAEEYGYHKGALELRIALCSKCGEMLQIPSIEETNKKIVKPYKEKEEEERYERGRNMLIPSFEETEDKDPLSALLHDDTDNDDSNNKNEEVGYVATPSNIEIFEVLIQPNKDSLEYSDSLANEIQTEKESIYAIIKDTPKYVGEFSKFPMYMINEMIEINPEIILYLKQSDFSIILQGLEYAKIHYYSDAIKLIIERIKEISSYALQLSTIYGEDWEKKFTDSLAFPEKLTELGEEK